ncbi:MAG: hypothetical protein ABWZ77_01220 [Naasia sp.]
MAALLALYIVLLGTRAVAFISTGEPVGVAIGIALLVLPFLGAYALYRELAFGVRSQRLVDRIAGEGSLPTDDLPRRASGRPERAAADAAFPAYREAAEREPDDWRSWLRLGLAYDASGDRRRARQAIRTAIDLERRRG